LGYELATNDMQSTLQITGDHLDITLRSSWINGSSSLVTRSRSESCKGPSQNSCDAKKEETASSRGGGQREDTQNVFFHAMLGRHQTDPIIISVVALMGGSEVRLKSFYLASHILRWTSEVLGFSKHNGSNYETMIGIMNQRLGIMT
jgi:hypothetical protein